MCKFAPTAFQTVVSFAAYQQAATFVPYSLFTAFLCAYSRRHSSQFTYLSKWHQNILHLLEPAVTLQLRKYSASLTLAKKFFGPKPPIILYFLWGEFFFFVCNFTLCDVCRNPYIAQNKAHLYISQYLTLHIYTVYKFKFLNQEDF